MELEQVKSLLLPIHAGFGIVALLVGSIALFAQKKRGKHTKIGAVFVVLMLLAILVAVPVIVLSRNLFLGGLGAVALYLVVMGWRIGKVRPPQKSVSRGDWSFVAICLLLFAIFVGFGVWLLFTGQMLGLAAAGIGYLGFDSAFKHYRFFKNPDASSQTWMEHHGSTMGGALIASLTAFSAAVLTNYLQQVPEFLIWLAPIALGAPIVNKQVKRGRG